MYMAGKMPIPSTSGTTLMILIRRKRSAMLYSNTSHPYPTTLNFNPMRYIFLNTLLLLSVIAVLSSCEKVIDLDLNEAEKKYVIEAIVTDKAGTARVTITQTKNFD